MKMTLKFLCAIAIIFVCSLLAGSLDRNYFLGIGLGIVMLSSFASIASASHSGIKAWHAAKKQYEPPEPMTFNSLGFKFTAGMMGVNRDDPLETIRKQLTELRSVAIQDEQNWRKLFELTNYRVNICLARLEYHEEVTLPKLIGSSAGTIIVSAIMAFVGSAYLAYPADFYEIFRQLYASARDSLIGIGAL